MTSTNISWSTYRYGDYFRGALQDTVKYYDPASGDPNCVGMLLNNGAISASIIKDFGVNWVVYMGRTLFDAWISPLSMPENLQRPQDNVEFLSYAEKRALHLWSPTEREAMEEALETQLSEEYEVFTVLGQWSIAAFYEMADKGIYKPTFITSSEALESDPSVSVMSTLVRFRNLRDSDKNAILEALYLQKPPLKNGSPLGTKAQDIYRDIRSLASLFHQGNPGFLQAAQLYFDAREHQAETVSRPLPVTVERPRAPAVYSTVPSAPRALDTLTQDVATLRSFIDNLPDHQLKSRIRAAIGRNHGGVKAVRSPGELDFSTLEESTLHTLTKLLILKKSENNPSRLGYPQSFPWAETLRSREEVRSAFYGLEVLNKSDRKKLVEAVLDPVKFADLDQRLQTRFLQVAEIAEKCLSVQRFRDMYQAYRTSLFTMR